MLVLWVLTVLGGATVGFGQSVAVRSVAVKGTLKCGQQPVPDAKIVLYRVNSKDETQILDERTSGPSGLFEVNANTNGRPLNETQLEPVVRFYHRCDVANGTKTGSSRSFQVGVPPESVSLGKMPKKTYDVGVLNLQITFPKESWEKENKKSRANLERICSVQSSALFLVDKNKQKMRNKCKIKVVIKIYFFLVVVLILTLLFEYLQLHPIRHSYQVDQECSKAQ